LPFIPRGEIWLDSAMSVEEAYCVVITQLSERRPIASGAKYDRAFDQSLIATMNERLRQLRLVARCEANLAAVRYGVREPGVNNLRSQLP
jgi:hypothetical protein